MMRMYLAMERELVVASKRDGGWQASTRLEGTRPVCLAADPGRPEVLYCGTYGRGLYKSEDAGSSWRPVGDPGNWMSPVHEGSISHPNVMAVAVSPTERANGHGVVYAGTEPSALFRSEDGGETWHELKGLKELPSAPTWSFPPRPHTSHVRWISPDPNAEGTLYVAVEAGALVRSADSGETWDDRQFMGPRDAHALAVHPAAPGRVCSAAGDGFVEEGTGYAESPDGGDTWVRPDEGLRHHYLWGVAVDPGNLDAVIVSAAESPNRAHNLANAASHVYRKEGDQAWREAGHGLPEPEGTLAPFLAVNSAEPGAFYALSNRGVHRSGDAGLSWERVEIRWRDRYPNQHHQALLVGEA